MYRLLDPQSEGMGQVQTLPGQKAWLRRKGQSWEDKNLAPNAAFPPLASRWSWFRLPDLSRSKDDIEASVIPQPQTQNSSKTRPVTPWLPQAQLPRLMTPALAPTKQQRAGP